MKIVWEWNRCEMGTSFEKGGAISAVDTKKKSRGEYQEKKKNVTCAALKSNRVE